ncbi:dihydrofolate reductase family protein [Marinobacter salinisoli]|uniref:Dihydrofolate reductase family protein n=1 Tax=Marinobacter salinisoli TaxID=2769486 RepID=A0ABX7MMA5_9GAMM|nr:dihydrofolate reductase family protein [Marinobacter salinisoli]QSP93321.1 dihydrofolate reductase family protein [Marinobacter salinisoli]
MKCSVFIATSADGYIATADDSVEWLETAGKPNVDLGGQADMGFNDYIASVDCMIMGRNCMEKLASFNLTDDQWPYKDIRIIALSKTVTEPPKNLAGKIEMYSGDIRQLIKELESSNFKHAYIDGGETITSFLNEQLINEITITQAPLLLGSGKPLFGDIFKEVKLTNAKATAFPNDFVQVRYDVDYL